MTGTVVNHSAKSGKVKSSTHIKPREAELIPGSMYQKENLEYISQTKAMAEDLFRFVSQDPALKKSSIGKKIRKVWLKLSDLEMTLVVRKKEKIALKKKQNAVQEDYWLFDSEAHIEYAAVLEISQEDMLHASTLFPKSGFTRT